MRADSKALRFYRENSTSNLLDSKYWYTEGITYSAITSKGTGFRYWPAIGAFGKGGATMCYVQNLYYVIAVLNTKVAEFVFQILNPTINLQVKDVKGFPIILNEKETSVSTLSQKAVEISNADWDSFETSWDFKKHPLI